MKEQVRNIEDCVFCLDCRKDITELREWKGKPEHRPHLFAPLRYCDVCISKAKEDGYFFVIDDTTRETMKTSISIEQMATESKLSWEQSARNQYF